MKLIILHREVIEMNNFGNLVVKASLLCQQMIDASDDFEFTEEMKDIKSSIEYSSPEVINFHLDRMTRCVNDLVKEKTKDTVTESEIAVLAIFTKQTPDQIRKDF